MLACSRRKEKTPPSVAVVIYVEKGDDNCFATFREVYTFTYISYTKQFFLRSYIALDYLSLFEERVPLSGRAISIKPQSESSIRRRKGRPSAICRRVGLSPARVSLPSSISVSIALTGFCSGEIPASLSMTANERVRECLFPLHTAKFDFSREDRGSFVFERLLDSAPLHWGSGNFRIFI